MPVMCRPFRAQNIPLITQDAGMQSTVSTDAKVESSEVLNPTKMRHSVSTLYARMNVPEWDRQLLYQHMAHSDKVNTTVHQAPLAHQEVANVARILHSDNRHNFIPHSQTCCIC